MWGWEGWKFFVHKEEWRGEDGGRMRESVSFQVLKTMEINFNQSGEGAFPTSNTHSNPTHFS